MSLRLRLILSYAALLLALGLAAWVGVHSLTADLTAALGETAASVGRSVFTVMRHDVSIERSVERVEEGNPGRIEHRVVVLEPAEGEVQRQVRMRIDGRELTQEEIARMTRSGAGDAEIDVHVEAGGEDRLPMLWLTRDGVRRAIPLPRAGVDAALERFSSRIGWGLLALFGLGLVLAVWLAQRIARPLRALVDATAEVAAGRLGAQAPSTGVPEVRRVIAAFNRMSARLQQLDVEAASLRGDRELAELGEIGRGLAHSLRNPLHALGLSLEALAAQAADPARAASLAQAGREQLQRVDQALRGFLALSTGSGSQPTAVALREVIDDVALEASQRAAGRVTLTREGEAVQLLAVPAELRVMLHALVINALEASPDGGRIVLRTRALEDGVEVEVRDAGAGIAESVRARLFQPHVSSKPHGAGMGLYLAERLARLRYHGSITLEPGHPCGTWARLRLRPRDRNVQAGAHD